MQNEEITEKEIDRYEQSGVNVWHSKQKISIGNTLLTFVGMLTGCGVGQLAGVRNLADDVNKKDFISKLQCLKEAGVGALFSTLGEHWYHKEAALLRPGFERVSEYNNYRHGDSYMQRAYILKL